MTHFSDLPHSPALPAVENGLLGEWQKQLDALFPVAVADSPLRLWAPGDPIPSTGRRLLIGVATWSAQDLALLDGVADSLEIPAPGLTIEVFNVADCTSPAAFERYIPGISRVFHTPVAGVWSDGQLIESASG